MVKYSTKYASVSESKMKIKMDQSVHLANEIQQYSPLDNALKSHHQAPGYGDVHLQGNRPSQEDGGLFVKLDSVVELSPAQVAERMWTTLKHVDDQVKQLENEQPDLKEQGTTACIATVHQNHLITANLADSVLFAVIYSPEGKVIGARRVTQNLHKPNQKSEEQRITSQGGRVFFNRVNGRLGVARAIGDHQYNNDGEVISSDASLGVFSLDEMQNSLNPEGLPVGKMQLIMTCDGFTEPADCGNVEHHDYLSRCLAAVNDGQPGTLSESELARALAEKAIADDSGDNVSVSVMTCNPQNTNTSYFAIFDGHGGQGVVNAVVQNFAKDFNQQLAMTEHAYQQQAQSVQNKQANFIRDNEAIFKMLAEAPAVQSQTATTTAVPMVQSQATTTTTMAPVHDTLAKRKAIESKAATLLADGHADKIIFKNKNYIANNPEHNEIQELELVQYVFSNAEKQLAFKTLIEQSSGSVLFCGQGYQNPYIVELQPEVVENLALPKKNSVATRKEIEQKASTIQGFSKATKVIFKNKNYIAGNHEHNQKQPLHVVQFAFANQEEQEKFKVLVEHHSQTKVAYSGDGEVTPNIVELFPEVVATMDIAVFKPTAPKVVADKVEQVIAHNKGITNSQAELQQLKKLLNLSDDFTIGEAIDDGGCFFDSLAQTLNQLYGTDIYSEDYLRLLCQEYFFANKEEVNTLNKADNGLELGDDYAFVKYSKAQLDAAFYGRSPIWGRPSVEGKILCHKLNLKAIYVVELIIDPDSGSLIPAVFKATKNGYTQLDVLPQNVIGKEPVLLVHQDKLHFVPLLSQVKPGHEKDKDKVLPKSPVVQATATDTTTVASQKNVYDLQISRHPRDSKKVLVKASLTPKLERKPQHVVFVLDRSHSMDSGGAIELVKEATKQLVRKALHPDDSFSIIVYDKNPEVLVPKTKQSEAKSALEKISKIRTGGGTEIQKGLALIGQGGSYPVQVDEVANTSIILLTDGDNGTKIMPENEVRLLKQRLGSNTAPVIVPIGVGRHYAPQFLSKFGKLTGLDTTIHISNGNTMAAGFNTAAKFIGPHLAESVKLKLSVTADKTVSEQAMDLGILFADQPGNYVFELDLIPDEVNVALTSTIDNRQLSTIQNLSEVARVDRDVVALYANQLLLQRDNVPFEPWDTYIARKEQRAVELERDILPLLSPAFASDSDLVKRVRSNLITIIKSLYGVLEDDNEAKEAKSSTSTTQVSSGAIEEFVKFGLTGLHQYNAETKSLSLGGHELRLAGSDIDYVTCKNRYLISFSASFNKSQAVILDQDSPVIKTEFKNLEGTINAMVTTQGKLEAVAQQVKGIFTSTEVKHWYDNQQFSLELGGNLIDCIPFEEYIQSGAGESRHKALLSSQFIANLVRKHHLANGTVRQFFGLSEDGKTAYSWVSYHPKGSNSLFIIDPSSQPAVYDLNSREAVLKARKDYAARGLAGILDGCLATYKLLKLEDQEPISDNLLGRITDEQVFLDKGYVDPISLEVMAKPVRIKGQPEQQIFDEASIKAWFATCGVNPINPLTRQPCSMELVPAINVRDKIILEIQAQNDSIPTEKVIEMYESRKQKRSRALANGLYALNCAMANGIEYSSDDLSFGMDSDAKAEELPLFIKPDITAIYNKFGGVRSSIGAASMLLANPGHEVPASDEIPFVQLGYSDAGEVELQLSFRNEKDARALLNLLHAQELYGATLEMASINHPEYGVFHATVMLKAEEIRSYLEDLCGLPNHETAFLFRVCGFGGYYCQQYLDTAELDGLEAALIGFQKSKAESSLGIISSNLQALFLAPPKVSAEAQQSVADVLLTIIQQVRYNKETARYERLVSEKPILEILKSDSTLKTAVKDYMDLITLLVSSSQYVLVSAPTMAV